MTEKETPFRPTRTQVIFKNAANVSLRGHTYDAQHLDKFLSSGYGEKTLQFGDSSNQNTAPFGQGAVSERRSGMGGGAGVLNGNMGASYL